MARLRVAALISGRGSNLDALAEACEAPDYPAEIALVVSNNRDAAGLDRAAHRGIARCVVDHRKFADKASFEAALDERLESAGIELVCLAGFMRLLSAPFVEHWRDRLINIHPSLLPAFRGLHTHEQALATGVRIVGCTVHFVRADMDAGPIIVQAAVPVAPGDTAETLAERVLAAEHRCYPLAVRWIAEGRVKVGGAAVTIEGVAAATEALINPLDA